MKTKLMKILALAMGAALACFALSACGGSSDKAAEGDYTLVKDGTLTVICSADFPPFEYMDGDNIKG